ncbi:hypothetical protein SAMN05421753_10149 [Planctomicrobium piriforme]|uniref:HEAT repeat-containing protein n=1 Tax=Planctomicrobium piriforme TaxID=1576369 RepID=A0A1I3ATK2_9PLAN|nr:hypothetical protein SAMN05421753_10149 [Planctomicrobium piriforme]
MLLKHLASCENNHAKSTIIGLLAFAQHSFDGTLLIQCYERTKDSEDVRWQVLNTIAIARPHSIDDWIEKLCENPFRKEELYKLGYRELKKKWKGLET